MNDFQKGILSVIKSSFSDGTVTIHENFPWDQAVDFAAAQNLDVMFWLGAEKCGVNIPAEYLTVLQNRAMMMIAHSVRQENEANTVFDLLEKNNIEFLPLKGAIMQYLYPETVMRFMSDIDVLIKPEQYQAIEKLMQNAGYDFVCKSNHEYIWDKKNVLHIEFHKWLIPSYNKDYFAYYGDGWQLAKRAEGSRYKMSDEDFFIYIFTHLAKHYRDSGIGLKHFIDVWVYLRSKPNLDEKYIESELVKLQLFEFYKNVRYTLSVWFESAEPSEVSDLITNWTFSGGTYGCREKNILSTAVKEAAEKDGKNDNRMMRLFYAVFMPYEQMCQRYSFLKKNPVLLPVMWVVRAVMALLFKRNNIKERNAEIKILTDANVNNYHIALNTVGLDFNFKE